MQEYELETDGVLSFLIVVINSEPLQHESASVAHHSYVLFSKIKRKD